MKLLLDTHTFIWFVENDKKLPELRKVQIEDEENSIYVSVGTFWEMSIKLSLGKMELSLTIQEVIEMAENNGFILLPLSKKNIVQVSSLPFYHRDPFDRMLIAQSLTEEMPIISIDEVFDLYGVERLW